MIQAIKGISFDVNQGEVIALIGANGAGKTTTLHTITGILTAKSGSVLFRRTGYHKGTGSQDRNHGNGTCPEGRRVFADICI